MFIKTYTGITDTEPVCVFLYEQMNAPYRINETEIVTLTSQDGVTYTASGVQDSWENVWNVTVTIQTRSAVVTWECTQVGPMANFSFSDFTVFW